MEKMSAASLAALVHMTMVAAGARPGWIKTTPRAV
jgi:hypothetical protein